MFYDSSRIIEKQEKYEKIRAYDVILTLEKKDLSNENMVAAVNLMMVEANNDFHKSVFSRAKDILLARRERK